MPHHDELIAHLIAYKRKHLGELAPGNYHYRGRNLLYEHVLPTVRSPLNFLVESRETITSYLRSNPRIKLHKYFHHLNSSQAFALNLFVPYFEGGIDASAALLAAFGQNSPLVRWEPEAIPDAIEGTNLDAVWETSDGTRTICEVKLSERDYGKARLDDRHLRKLDEIYLPRLAQHISPDLQRPSAFFQSYQILRNIWHMVGDPKNHLVFLIPHGSSSLRSLLNRVITGVSAEVRDRIRVVTIEDVLEGIAANLTAPLGCRTYAEKMWEKYVVPARPMSVARVTANT